MVGHGDQRRLLADGAGLRSPGLWPPERRNPPTEMEARLHNAFAYELGKLDQQNVGGLQKVLGDLVGGRVEADPFPPEATARLRD